MSRWFAMLLAVVGGAAAAFATTGFGTVVLYGALWIFFFGDDPWPVWAETGLNLIVPIIGLLLWGLFGWIIWKRLTDPPEAG